MNKNIINRIFQVLALYLIQGVLLFSFAGTLHWQWAWFYLFLSMTLMLLNYLLIPKDVIEERGREKSGVKKWDKALNNINIIPTVFLYAASGLDYRLNLSTEFPFIIHLNATVTYITGSLIFTWSMRANPFFSTLVRIQTDRGHNVIASGPYKIVRHPGYCGYILMSLSTALILGSLWGLLFAGISTVLFVVRTALEDNTLMSELPGYKIYASEVKFRLLPGVW